jgi:hypothetical protein
VRAEGDQGERKREAEGTDDQRVLGGPAGLLVPLVAQTAFGVEEAAKEAADRIDLRFAFRDHAQAQARVAPDEADHARRR